MASISPHSTSAGPVPVEDKRDRLLARLVLSAARLSDSQLTYALGGFTCELCKGHWTVTESPRHVSGCMAGDVSRVLEELHEEAFDRNVARNCAERRSSEPADRAAGAAGTQPRAVGVYGEPWSWEDGPYRYGLFSSDGSILGAPHVQKRVAACVNFCAGVSSELLAELIPLASLGVTAMPGAGLDALLGKKGGAR